jgi:hypothetical protein
MSNALNGLFAGVYSQLNKILATTELMNTTDDPARKSQLAGMLKVLEMGMESHVSGTNTYLAAVKGIGQIGRG